MGDTTGASAGALLDALGDPTRRRLVEALSQRGACSPTELAAEVGVSRQAVSKHLARLEAVGLVAPARDGRSVRFDLVPAQLDPAQAWLDDVGRRWDDRLRRLRRHVAPG